MASTFTTGFGIEKIGSGEQDGAWGTTTNYNLDILDRIASYKTIAITTNADTATLTVREASPGAGTENLQDGMYRVIKFTGTLDSACTITIAPNDSPAWFIIENATSGSQSLILSQGSGANVTVQNGKNVIIYCDGAGGGAAVVNALSDLQIATLEVTGAAAIDGALTAAAITATTVTTSGIVSVDDTTTSTSGTTGSIHTDGGLGVAGTAFVVGTAKIVGVTTHGGNVVSDTDSTDDLGTTGVRWANLYVDAITATDQVTATGFTGTLDGILGSGTPAAATVTTIDASGVATATTFEPDGDTAAGDNAAIGYTAAEGLILTGQGSTSDITFKNDADATVMSIPTGTSNVGIGTTAPAARLHVEGAAALSNIAILVNNTSTNGFSALNMGGTDAGVYRNGSANSQYGGNSSLNMITVGAHPIAFSTSNTLRMTITSAGNVGIGTAAPASELHVVGDAQVTGTVKLTDGGSVLSTVSNQSVVIGGGATFSDGANILMYGSTHAQTGAFLFRNDAVGRFSILRGGDFRFYNQSAAEVFRIDTAGNVGIGTASPASKLHVAGDVTVAGGVTGVASINSGQLAGNRNIIINGDFTLWQRGTADSALSTSYLADRWAHMNSQAALHSRQAFVASGTHPGNSQYVLRASGDSTTALSRIYTAQGIESINCIPLRGKTITMSLYLRCAAATMPTSSLGNLTIWVGSTSATADASIQSTDYSASGNTATTFAQGSLPTTWTKITNTYTVPTNTNNIAAAVGFASNVDAGTGDWYEISQVQVEVGSTATPFEQRLFGTELALCQRYYQLWAGGWNGVSAGASYAQSTALSWNTTMRANPTIARTGGTTSTRYPSTAWGSSYATTTGAVMYVTAVSSGGNELWQATGTASAEL